MAIYYGSLADRIGRRVVIGMAVSGYLLMLVWIVGVCTYHGINHGAISQLNA